MPSHEQGKPSDWFDREIKPSKPVLPTLETLEFPRHGLWPYELTGMENFRPQVKLRAIVAVTRSQI